MIGNEEHETTVTAPRVIPVRSRISEQTPRDLVGVDLLAERLARRGLAVEEGVAGRREPSGVTPWRDDLAASPLVLGRLVARVGEIAPGTCPVVLGSDCAVAIATLPAIGAAYPDARVLWLDAHSDYDTPETTTYSFLGAMSLAGATGAWTTGFGAIAPERVVLCGARAKPGDFDAAAQAAVEQSPVTVVGVDDLDRVVDFLGAAPVYVHLDTDVLDPADNPLPYGRPGGLRLPVLTGLLRAVSDRGPVVGIEVTAFHASKDAARRASLADALAAVVLNTIPPNGAGSNTSLRSPADDAPIRFNRTRR